ncbi:endonuclease III [bacterium B17]|nr:endonuclease III [bacterium B17]
MKTTDIPQVHSILKKEYAKHDTPVVEFIQEQTKDPFKVLVTTILSARTKDETTTEVTRRMFKVINKPDDLKKIALKKLEKLIFPIGFFRTKAKHLKQLPVVMDKLFDGKVPDNIDDLCKLPGVGRKTANLVVTVAFDKYGICVDVHVHRICNRLGLIKTKDPFETEMTLREILPKRYWKTWNCQLVSYGQRTCRPVSPKCDECPIYKYCDRIGVT